MKHTRMYDPDGFEADLVTLINKYRLADGSNTPDYLLADYLVQCLITFEMIVDERERWHGRVPVRVPVPLGFARRQE